MKRTGQASLGMLQSWILEFKFRPAIHSMTRKHIGNNETFLNVVLFDISFMTLFIKHVFSRKEKIN